MEASWEEALECIAERMLQIRQEAGSDALGFLGSPHMTNEGAYLFQKFARVIIGTNNIDNGTRSYASPLIDAFQSSIGYPTPTNPIGDIEKADVILVVGANLNESAPVVGYHVKRAVLNHEARLIVVDPRKIPLVKFSDFWLRPHPGTDGVAIHGMTKLLLEKGLQDKAFIESHTRELTEVKAFLEDLDIDQVESVTGLNLNDLSDITLLISEAERAAFIFGKGVLQQQNATFTVQGLVNLALLTGNVGKEGGGLFPIFGESNGLGACNMGVIPDFLPGYASLSHETEIRKFEKAWESPLPKKPGLNALEMIQGAMDGKIKGLYIIGQDIVSLFPAPSKVSEALKSLSLLVVQDIFPTKTTPLADVVLPSVTFAEQEGTVTSLERRVQRMERATHRVGEGLPDAEIISHLAQKIGHPLKGSSPKEILEEISQVVLGYQGMGWEELGKKPFFWPQDRPRITPEMFPQGKALFSVSDLPGSPKRLEDYPLILITGKTHFHFGSGTRTHHSFRLHKMAPKGFVEIGAEDAKEMDLTTGDHVKITSTSGSVELRVKVYENLRAGFLFAPLSFKDSRLNSLWDSWAERRGSQPCLKTCAVRLEKM